jgi:hypothetical protein
MVDGIQQTSYVSPFFRISFGCSLVLASSLLKKEDSLEWSNPKSNGGPMES